MQVYWGLWVGVCALRHSHGFYVWDTQDADGKGPGKELGPKGSGQLSPRAWGEEGGRGGEGARASSQEHIAQHDERCFRR